MSKDPGPFEKELFRELVDVTGDEVMATRALLAVIKYMQRLSAAEREKLPEIGSWDR